MAIRKLGKTTDSSRLPSGVTSQVISVFNLLGVPGYDPFIGSDNYYFDPDAASKAVDFFGLYLIHIKGRLAGQKLKLELWQVAIIANIFGWRHKENHTRRYREVFIFLPRKNGKTVLAAGIALYMLYCDGEAGAEVYCAAADREQATLVFDHAKGMVNASSALSARGRVYTKSIVRQENNSFFKIISADAHTKHGFHASCCIIDELHAQPNRELVDVLTTSTGMRTQPLTIYITTSDYERPSICNEKYDYACKVRDNLISDSPEFLPVVYETLQDEDWTDERTWRKANPIYDTAPELQAYLKKEFTKAKNIPTYENTFKRLHLNMKTRQDVKWIDIVRWKECPLATDIDSLEGELCYGGLDLASTQDVAAFVLFFPDRDCTVLPFFFVPKETAEQRETFGRVPYATWARQGFITLTEGNVIDYDYIRNFILECNQKYFVKEIAYDRWAATQIVTQLRGEGIAMEPFGQGFASMNAPCKEFEKLIIAREMTRVNNPVMDWMVSNVAATRDAHDNIKPAKDKSADKIDGVVALCMALGRAMTYMTSVYDTRGVLQL